VVKVRENPVLVTSETESPVVCAGVYQGRKTTRITTRRNVEAKRKVTLPMEDVNTLQRLARKLREALVAWIGLHTPSWPDWPRKKGHEKGRSRQDWEVTKVLGFTVGYMPSIIREIHKFKME
jgi:hypothetical protein